LDREEVDRLGVLNDDKLAVLVYNYSLGVKQVLLDRIALDFFGLGYKFGK